MPTLTPPAPRLPETRDEQARNLRLIAAFGILLAIGMTVLGAALYLGAELPPHDFRVMPTSPDGYAPPPLPKRIAVAGTVARGARAFAAPGEPPADGTTTPPSPALADRWTNPLNGNPEAVTQGAHLYQINCVMCHGDPGSNKPGSVGEAYTPFPPDLAASHLSDGQSYYRITYGIVSTPTAEAARYLPRDWHAFGPLLRPQERWQLVTFLWSLRQGNAYRRNSVSGAPPRQGEVR